MKKKMRVLEIRGFKGLALALFVTSCLIAGFIAFPGFVAMNTWNYLANKTLSFPTINFLGGVLLWGIALMTFFITRKKKPFSISFASPQELTDAEVQQVLSKIKSQSTPPPVVLSDFEPQTSEEKNELASAQINKED